MSRLRAAALISVLLFRAPTVTSFALIPRSEVLPANRIVFGTAALSRAEDPLALLDAAYDKGFRRFDLARTYGDGASERLFGEWLEDNNTVKRSDIEVVTKGGMGMDKFGNPDRPLLDKNALRQEVLNSLVALKTDYIDTYMLHRDDPRLGVSFFVDTLNEFVRDGRIRNWGVSNWSFARIQEAHAYAKAKNLVPPTVNSPQFSIAVPSRKDIWPTTYSISGPEADDEIRWHEENGVELMCWEVLAKGFMAKPDQWAEDDMDVESLTASTTVGTDAWRLQVVQSAYCTENNYERRRIANRLAKKFGMTLAQVSLLYPLCMGSHISVIFGTQNVDHLAEIISLRHFELDGCAMDQLSSTLGDMAQFPDSSRLPRRPATARVCFPHKVASFSRPDRKIKQIAKTLQPTQVVC